MCPVSLDHINRTNINQTEPLTASANVADKNYTYNTANQIQTAGTTSFTSDDNGNLKTQTTGGVTINYNYDIEDRLKSATDGTTGVQYIYNGIGQRLARTVGGATTRFVLDPTSRLPRILAETDQNGNITNYYTHGLGLISKVRITGQAYQYHFDMRGSTVAITDATQKIVNRYAYDSFGSVTASSEQTSNPFGYIGQFGVTSEPLNLQFASRRFFAPALGRFLTKDAAESSSTNPQTLNEYIYSLNNPVILIDPSGLSGERDGTSRFEQQGTSDKQHGALVNLKIAFTDTIKTVPDFIACGGSGFILAGACKNVGQTDFSIALGKDTFKVILSTISGGVLPSVYSLGSALYSYRKSTRNDLTQRENLNLGISSYLSLAAIPLKDELGASVLPTSTVSYLIQNSGVTNYVYGLLGIK